MVGEDVLPAIDDMELFNALEWLYWIVEEYGDDALVAPKEVMIRELEWRAW